MKKCYLVWGVMLAFTGCAMFQNLTGGGESGPVAPTEAEMIAGLKEALKVGSQGAADGLSRTGGYNQSDIYKIFLPPEAQAITENLSKIPGGQKMVDDTITRINAAAESAATKAGPIFVNAITSMTISDALGILKGSDTAATEYLKRTTGPQLKQAFAPDLDAALRAPIVAGISAESSWNTLVTNYNRVADVEAKANALLRRPPTMQPVNTSLNDYVMDKALDALFSEVGKVEQNIRKDPLSYAQDIIKKVFSYFSGT
ncbi:hypothetical protein FACS1894172_05380 [Spirochaetia bacterium]|nr:hypothetical protein FACS1894172_05380 [Spirochaetia bacterium]